MRWRATWMPPRGGDPPLHCGSGLGQRGGPGEADTLEAVPFGGRDGAGQGAPQHPILGDDVHQLAIQADAGPLPGQRRADQDQPVQQGDAAGAGDQPVHLDAPAGSQHTGGRPGRWRACRAPIGAAQPGQVHPGQAGRHGLDPPPADTQVAGGDVDPQGDLLPGAGSAQPELLRPDGHEGPSRTNA